MSADPAEGPGITPAVLDEGDPPQVLEAVFVERVALDVEEHVARRRLREQGQPAPGAVAVDLGPLRLRAETAALVLLAVARLAGRETG
jgi:hypothetical protein